MTEKQTFSSESRTPTPSQDGELISQDELDMINQWAEKESAKAAQRLVDITPLPIDATPTAPQPATESVADTARPSFAPAAPTPRNPRTPDAKPSLTGKQVAGGIAAGAALVAGGFGLNHMGGGDNLPERGDLDTSISSITLEQGANIRFDPEVKNAVTGPTLIESTDAEVTVTTDEGVRVLEDTNNGTWYGFEATQIPDLGNTNDKDGIVWVNEAGIDSIERNNDAQQ